MASSVPLRFKTIEAYYQFRGVPAPEHPLVSVVRLETLHFAQQHTGELSFVFDFYSISLKRMPAESKIRYGQQEYDFNAGVMFFISPGQVFSVEVPNDPNIPKVSGWALLVHPDFLWGTSLLPQIAGYEYFNYSVNEALHLSGKEETKMEGIIESIQQEYYSNIDVFSQDVIIAHLELLLTYADRFYHRQFITRKKSAHQILARLEELLTAHFNGEHLSSKGLPSVHQIALALHVSPGYLGTLLRGLTGKNTQQHIHDKLIEKAKEKISTTNLSVSEIAYELGFEHQQSFSKFFKNKTSLSPLEFRQSFN